MDSGTLLLMGCFLIPILMFAVERLLKFTPPGPLDDAWFDRQGEKYRPLSDEEFVARCQLGTRPETALKVRSIIAEVSGIPEERIHPEHSWGEDLWLD